MNISIRIKFFIVLLAFSLGPLLIARAVMGKASLKILNGITSETRKEMYQLVSSELEKTAESLLLMIDGRGQAMALGARVLAQQVELTLGGSLKGDNSAPYFIKDFNNPKTAPPDLSVVAPYARQSRSGKERPLPVSLGHPAYSLPRGENVSSFSSQISAINGLTRTLKEIHANMGGTAYWMHVSLESGLYAVYPGHGNYPMMFDPRQQDWYRETRKRNTLSWSSPIFDPSSKQVMAIVSYPIRDNMERFIGAASVDIPLSSILHESGLESQWSDQSRAYMVMRHTDEQTGKTGLLIIAQRNYGSKGRHWMAGIEQEWMAEDDPSTLKQLVEATKDKGSGHLRLPHKGSDSVWAYANNGEGMTFLIVVPETVMMHLPNEVAATITGFSDSMRDASLFIGGMMLMVTGFIAWFGSRAITRPLLRIAAISRRIAGGDFNARIRMRTGDERDHLIDAINDMGPKLEEHLRISKDLALAQEVQKILLPHAEPKFPGFDISGGISYCDQTGGDYYDFIDVNCPRGPALAVVLGDVSGHGVPSALIMATARGQLHSLSKAPLTAEDRITAINNFLSKDLDETGRFLTLFYLQLEPDTNEVRWVRAGHDPAICYDRHTDSFNELRGEGLPLGVLGGTEYPVSSRAVAPDEVVVLATDGVWEATNKVSGMFGKERMLAIIKDNAHKNAEDIRTAIMNAVAAYRDGDQEDDIAVVVIKKA